MPKIGDRVRIKAYIASLKHRKNKNGVVVDRDGAYITVRPMWCSWTIELYSNELTILK